MPEKYSNGHTVAYLALLIIGFLCFFILSTQRMNMTIGMLCMVNWSQVKTANFCSAPNSRPANLLNDSAEMPENVPAGEFPWSVTLQSLIHASYFFGLLISYLPVEKLLVEKFTAKYLVLTGMLLSSTCNLLTPMSARLHIGGLILVRILKAVGHVIVSLSFSVIFGQWIPTKQLISSMCLATSGVPFGAFFIVILTGFTCNDLNYSWPFVFYLTGSVGIAWCLIWLYFCFDVHFVPVLISSYRNPDPDFPKLKRPVPYADILTSPPFWSYVTAGIASYWILAMNMFLTPIYFRNVFDTSIEWNGQLSSFPNVLQAFLYIFSFTLLTKKFGSRTGRRRACTCLGILIFAACMVLLSFVKCRRPLGALLMVMGIGFFGFTQAAISLIAVDMSPNFSGTLSAIMNTIGAGAGCFLPISVALITEGEEKNIRDWEKVFYVSFFVTFISMILFMAFCSCDIQPWNDLSEVPLKTNLVLQLYESDSSLDEILPGPLELAATDSLSSSSKSTKL